jgi:hypothetical protein
MPTSRQPGRQHPRRKATPPLAANDRRCLSSGPNGLIRCRGNSTGKPSAKSADLLSADHLRSSGRCALSSRIEPSVEFTPRGRLWGMSRRFATWTSISAARPGSRPQRHRPHDARRVSRAYSSGMGRTVIDDPAPPVRKPLGSRTIT